MGLMDWARSGRDPVTQPPPATPDLTRHAAQLLTKLGATGVAASAVIDALRPTGQPDISGGQRLQVFVTITPTDGQPYQATILQSFLPSQMENLSPGRTIGIRYDPEDPAAALISTW